MALEPPDISSGFPAAKTICVRYLPIPKLETQVFYKLERNQSARIPNINTSLTLPLLYALLIPEGSELGPCVRQ